MKRITEPNPAKVETEFTDALLTGCGGLVFASSRGTRRKRLEPKRKSMDGRIEPPVLELNNLNSGARNSTLPP
ncbi:MAG: hypothetical protein OXF72_04855 [Gammaproteobacteria bacterium]|nr:hypothetical protein [Gammaproteobacteria bacterium]